MRPGCRPGRCRRCRPRVPPFARAAFTDVVACAPASQRGQRSRLAAIRQVASSASSGSRSATRQL